MKFIVRTLTAALALGLLADCGGGGGSSTAPAYSGVTTQATVNAANAKALSADAYSGTQTSASVGVGKTAADTPETVQAQALSESLTRSIAACFLPKQLAKALDLTVQNTITGASGSYNYSISVDQASGAFSGTISFNQYKEFSYSAPLSGGISFSGVYNQTAQDFTSLTINVASLQATQGSVTLSLSGTITRSATATTKTLTMSLVLTNNSTNRSFWLKDFTLALTGNSLTMSGTYYDSLHGYVVMTTITPLTVSEFAANPTAGVLLFTGSSGTKARLTFTATGYTVDVDTTGSNTFVVVP